MIFNIHDWIVWFETKSHEEQSTPANISPTNRRGFLLAEANHKTGYSCFPADWRDFDLAVYEKSVQLSFPLILETVFFLVNNI